MRSDALDPAELDVPGGVGTRAEWLAAGASPRMFYDGRLLAITTQIFALPAAVSDPLQMVRLVGGLAPEGTVVTGWAAALLHGVRDANPTMLHKAGTPIQICLAREDNRSPNGFATLRVALDPDDVVVIDGLPVTTPARTAYDMARFSRSVPAAVGVLDAFRYDLNPVPIDMDQLALRIGRRPRGRGHPQLRNAIALSSSRSRSVPESVLRARMIATLDLDPSEVLVNAMLYGERRRWELDLVDMGSGLVIEYDSIHHASVGQRETDALKDLEVRESGLGIVRVNAVTLGKPDYVLAAYLRKGQRHARELGGMRMARDLVSAARLAELELRNYASAGQPDTLSDR